MLNFLTPSALLSYVNMSGTPDFIAAAQAALDTATLCLVSDLRTEFDQATITDTFAPNYNDPYTKLKLRQGFVNAQPAAVVTQFDSYESMAVYNGTSIVPFPSADPVITSSNVLTPNCVIDPVKGVVKVNNVRISGYLITVAYTAGFAPDATDASLYDQTSVPAWLVALANLRARVELCGHPAFMDSKAVYNPKVLLEQYGTIVARHTRYVPDSILTV
jgi:hypothetical protein